MSKKKPETQCLNCAKFWPLNKLDEVRDFALRTEPGEEVPAGECPECNCLCYIVREHEAWHTVKSPTKGHLEIRDENNLWVATAIAADARRIVKWAAGER